jgi:hypothetical protein
MRRVDANQFVPGGPANRKRFATQLREGVGGLEILEVHLQTPKKSVERDDLRRIVAAAAVDVASWSKGMPA